MLGERFDRGWRVEFQPALPGRRGRFTGIGGISRDETIPVRIVQCSRSSDIKPQIDKAMKEATEFGNKIAAQENTDALDAIKKSGKVTIYEVSAADKKTWMDAMLPVHEWAVSRCGKEIVDLLHKESGFHT